MKLLIAPYLLLTSVVAFSQQDSNKVQLNIDSKTYADSLLKVVEVGNECDRSGAACELVDLRHPEALSACLLTLNDCYDANHLDYTPSVDCLIRIGDDALKPLCERMASKDPLTRLRAQRAFEGITKNIFEKENKDWLTWYLDVGYDWESKKKIRKKAIIRLNDWLNQYFNE